MNPEPRYFAVWDFSEHLDQAMVTYWYRVQRGRDTGKIKPWPPRRSPFWTLYKSAIPAELEGEEREKWVSAWVEDRRASHRFALDEIDAQPEECAAYFAALQAHCCCCGKGLIDERSVAYGIGPECRAGMSPAAITAISAMVAVARARAHPSPV